MNAAAAALKAASTSVVVTILSLLVGDRQQRRREAQTQRQDLNSRYLNPLRLHLVENYYRLTDVMQAADLAGGVYEPMLTIEQPEKISGKDAVWFNGTGCALASSAYLSACLFAQLKKVRDDFPYRPANARPAAWQRGSARCGVEFSKCQERGRPAVR